MLQILKAAYVAYVRLNYLSIKYRSYYGSTKSYLRVKMCHFLQNFECFLPHRKPATKKIVH